MVIHCAVMGPRNDQTIELVKYLIKVCPASLEAKSKEGHTPLYLAALLGRVKLAKTLIEAGADQSVKDAHSENLIHAALTNNPDGRKLRQFFDLLDTELRSHLFLQRNRLSNGGDTPLHMWLKAANGVPYEWSKREPCTDPEDGDKISLLRIILEYSGGHDLGILNGAGDTVLHSAVFRMLPGQMRVILESDPKLLYRENSVGRTPVEIAYDRLLEIKIGAPPGVGVAANDPYSYDNSYATMGPGEFLKDRWRKITSEDEQKKKPRARREQTWEVAREFRDRFPGTRRLVSLNEANDVARRLGESYAWQRYHNYVRSNNEDSRDADEAAEEEKKEEEKKEETEEEKKKKEEEGEDDFVASKYHGVRYSAWHKEGDDDKDGGKDDDNDESSKSTDEEDGEDVKMGNSP